MQPPISLDIRDGIGWITLDRPSSRNAIDPDLAQALADAARRCSDDTEFRCVMIKATGKFFCVGGAIDRFAEAGSDIGHDIKALATVFIPLCCS